MQQCFFQLINFIVGADRNSCFREIRENSFELFVEYIKMEK
jgi:hypothetical protein